MMRQSRSLKEIWNKNQTIVPEFYRTHYDNTINFCIQERNLRDKLINSNLVDYWSKWKFSVRPQIIVSRSAKYTSNEFMLQRTTEYSRRAKNWTKLLTDILKSEKVKLEDKLIDVGSNEGEEVAGLLKYRITCIEPSDVLCKIGKAKYPHLDFIIGRADCLPLDNNSVSVYFSLRTWCVAGVLADEALLEAKRVLRSQGLLIISLPVRYNSKYRSWENIQQNDKITSVAEWAMNLLNENLINVKTFAGPEELFMYGRLK